MALPIDSLHSLVLANCSLPGNFHSRNLRSNSGTRLSVKDSCQPWLPSSSSEHFFFTRQPCHVSSPELAKNPRVLHVSAVDTWRMHSLPSARELSGEELMQEDWNEREVERETAALPQGSHNTGGNNEPDSVPFLSLERILSWTELVCLVVSLVGMASSIFRGWLSKVAVAGTFSWPFVPFVAALLINAFQRIRREQIEMASWETAATNGRREWTRERMPLGERIGKLEEDVGSTAQMLRMLSRQLEKLGVRFRVTRRTLREPIKDTAELAEQTSNTVDGLTVQVERTESELRQMQFLLMAMQDQAARQLEIFASAIQRSQKIERDLQQKVVALEKKLAAVVSISSTQLIKGTEKTGGQKGVNKKTQNVKTLNGSLPTIKENTTSKVGGGGVGGGGDVGGGDGVVGEQEGRGGRGILHQLGNLGLGILGKGEEESISRTGIDGGRGREEEIAKRSAPTGGITGASGGEGERESTTIQDSLKNSVGQGGKGGPDFAKTDFWVDGK